MSETSTSTGVTSGRSRRWWRRAARAALGFGGTLALLSGSLLALLHVPKVQRTLTSIASREAGAALDASVEAGSLRWNLLDGRLEARDIAIRGRGERSGTAFTLARLAVDVSIRSLLSGKIVVERVRADALGARLAVDEKGRLVLPIVIPETKDEEETGRPDVVIRDFLLSGGSLELADRGPAGRRVEARAISLSGNLSLRELVSTGSLAVGSVDVSAAGKEPLRGSSVGVEWGTHGTTARLEGSVTSPAAGLMLRLEGKAEELATAPRYSGVVAVSGTLGPLAARLLPDLGLGGTIEARAELDGTGAELPALKGTARAEGLGLLGRTFERADLSFDSAAGAIRAATLDVTVGNGRFHAEAAGTVVPAVKDVTFRLRADRLDVARLLPQPARRTSLAAVLTGEVAGALAEPSSAGITAKADLAVSASVRRGTGALAPDVRLRARVANGIVTVDEVSLREGGTRGQLTGTFDVGRRVFAGRLDLESPDLGPYLGLAGLEGRGTLSAHLRGRGSLSRPEVEGTLRGRSLLLSGASVECVELDATVDGRKVAVRNGFIEAYDATAGVEADGTLRGPSTRASEVDLRLRGIAFRRQRLPDVEVHATIGPTVEASLETADGRLSVGATLPSRGGFSVRAAADRLDLRPMAGAFPSHLADFEGVVTGRVEAARGPSGPLSASVVLGELAVTAGGRRITSAGAQASIRDGAVEVPGIALHADDGSHLQLSGKGSLDGRALDVRLRAEIPQLGALAAFAMGADALAGSVSADLAISGDRERPRLAGTFGVRDLVVAEAGIERLDATFTPGEQGALGARISVTGLRYGDYRLPAAELEGTLAGDGFSLAAATFGQSLRLEARGSLAGERPFSATATLADLDLANVLRIAGAPPSIGGVAAGRIDVRGTLDDPKRASIETELTRLELADGESRLVAQDPVRLTVDRGRSVEVRSLRLAGSGLSLTATGSLPFEGKDGAGLTVDATFQLRSLLPFVHRLDRARGRLAARLHVSGNVASPSAEGTLTVADGLLDGPSFPAPVEKLSGTVALRRSQVEVESLEARIGGGRVTLKGSLALDGVEPRRVEAVLSARDLDLEVERDLQLRAGADLAVAGDWPSLAVSGDIRIEDATYVPRLEIMTLLKGLTSRAERRAPPAKDGAGPGVEVALDIAVVAKDAIHVEGSLGEVEASANLRVKGTVDAPVVLGAVASSRGTLNVLGSSFDVSRARLDFSDPLAVDPDVDVVATTTKSDEEITVRIEGKASKAQLIMASSKGRSQAEILSVLLGGSGEPGSTTALAASATRMAVRGASAPLLGSLGAQADVELVPLPTTPEGENFLFSVGKDLGGGVSATYFKGLSGETTDAIELKWRISSRTRGRLRQNQDGSLSGGFRIRREFD